ncbi:hypothetical protein [Pandoraea sputorum]|uniref:Uncharacterized protein n=1 Tax=Pandoraea sputorum TaxID=93222 RepID=A0A5E5AYF9_9BURK|nr:hypothetical protein [Pandoraea sputorum]VVE77795.1 hypothetical protein PSP31121_01370 [Pandoraea sputorum]
MNEVSGGAEGDEEDQEDQEDEGAPEGFDSGVADVILYVAEGSAVVPLGIVRRVGGLAVFGAPRDLDAGDEAGGGGTFAVVRGLLNREVVERDVLSLRAGMADSVRSLDVGRAFH